MNTAFKDKLMDELMSAHYRSCFRDNASSLAVANAARSSGELTKAITAGLASLGGKHAPIEGTVRLLSANDVEAEVDKYFALGQKVPGWGGTFQQDDRDPLWITVDQMIHADWPELGNRLDAITRLLHSKGKIIFPNPSAYTACAAIIMGLSPRLAPMLFLRGRMNGWYEIAAKYLEV
jgi:citrate synthase